MLQHKHNTADPATQVAFARWLEGGGWSDAMACAAELASVAFAAGRASALAENMPSFDGVEMMPVVER